MQEHTPGPWTADKRYGVLHTEVYAPSIGRAIAYVWTYNAPLNRRDAKRDDYTPNPEWMANARLIAAAPKLLEACIQARAALPDAWLAAGCDCPADVVELLNEAISEAQGQAVAS